MPLAAVRDRRVRRYESEELSDAAAEPTDVFVIMGARVEESGAPSGALTRRLDAALAAGRLRANATYLATGGSDGRGPTEADAMKRWLTARGVIPERVWLDPDSRDTLESISRCARIIQAHPEVRSVAVCSDRYHQARCRWLFRLYGVYAGGTDAASGRAANGTRRWTWYYVREALAFPYDTAIVLGQRLMGRR